MIQPVSRLRVCPICGFGMQVPLQEDKSLVNKDILFSRHFAELKGVSLFTGYNVVCCFECGGVYADNIPNQKEFEDYYRKLSKYEQTNNQILGGQHYLDKAELLSRGLPDKNACILDIGCGNGYFLYALQKLGYTNLEGLEPSPACARYTQTEFGIPCMEGMLTQLKSTKQESQYDAIILYGVLEHLVNVSEAIEIISQIIKTNGLLFIGVPNTSDFNPAVNAPYQEFSTEHINYFCLDSLQNLLGQYGFELALLDLLCNPGNIICGFKKTDIIRQIEKENRSKTDVMAYIRKSAEIEKTITKTISCCGAEKFVVWGTGTLTLYLLASGILNTDNIKVFVDSNPHYIGSSFQGILVIGPEELVASDNHSPILISSFVWYNEILSKIRNELKLKNEVISLII
jgi:SAM-dependent methyltransferase